MANRYSVPQDHVYMISACRGFTVRQSEILQMAHEMEMAARKQPLIAYKRSYSVKIDAEGCKGILTLNLWRQLSPAKYRRLWSFLGGRICVQQAYKLMAGDILKRKLNAKEKPPQ